MKKQREPTLRLRRTEASQRYNGPALGRDDGKREANAQREAAKVAALVLAFPVTVLALAHWQASKGWKHDSTGPLERLRQRLRAAR